MKKLYYRFGDIPEDGYSSIWRIDELIGKEKGVSVYEAYKNIDGTYVPVIPLIPKKVIYDDNDMWKYIM